MFQITAQGWFTPATEAQSESETEERSALM